MTGTELIYDNNGHPRLMNVSPSRLDAEIVRVQKEVARARKAVAELISESQLLGSVQPDDSAVRAKYDFERR